MGDTAAKILKAHAPAALCALLALLCPCRLPAQGPEAKPLSADIAAQPLAEALALFSRQTGLHVVYLSRIVHEQHSRGVSAGLGATEALARLLEGTGLRFEFLTAHSVRLVVAPRSAPAPVAEAAPLQEVMVTGSRIPVPANISATSPIQIVSAAEISLQGHTDTSEVINALPQIISSSGADFGNHSSPSNTAGGFATADLRGLGPQRTVVLINGRRLGLGDPNTANPTPAPDLDQIPLSMVERIEVLTGGASATYGSDAVAGVVNFILKDQVQGIQVDGEYGFAEHTQKNAVVRSAATDAGLASPTGTRFDAFHRDVSVLAGTAFADGAGKLTAYFTYKSQDPLHGEDRDYTACSALSSNWLSADPTVAGITCLPSGQSNRFVTAAGAAYAVLGDRFVPWPADNATPPSHYNSVARYNSQRQDDRYQTGVLARFEPSEAFKPYLEFSFMQDKTVNEISPSGLFTQANPYSPDGGYLINCSNPLLSAQEASLLCTPAQIALDRANPGSVSADVNIARRNVEGGGRLASYLHRNYRAVGGLEGRLNEAFSFDAYALYYYTSLEQVESRFLSFRAINNALQVSTDAAGHPQCISAADCVPYNIFGTGPVSAEQLAYLSRSGTDGGSNSEQILEADLTGQLDYYGLLTPWAHEGLAFNLGAEHRLETLRFGADAAELTGDLSGYGVSVVAIDRHVSVNEGFVEVRLPIAQGEPGIKDFTVGAGYRYSSYSTAGTTSTYKFDVQFAPLTDVRLRASFDRVARAPNLIELYTPPSYNISNFIEADPCAPTDGGLTHAGASLAACMHTGVTAAQYGNGLGAAAGGTNTIPQCFVGCGVVAGGNARLTPESATTWSLGLSLTPTALPALSASLDYYRIQLRGAIGTVPETVTLSQCLATGDPSLCSQIVRAPSGALNAATIAGGGYILTHAVNTGAAMVSGADLQANFRQPLGGFGALEATLSGSWLQHAAATPYQSSPSYDCAGLFGATCLNGSVNPSWRHNLRLTWETIWPFKLSTQWRFIGRTGFDNNSPQPLLRNQEEGFFDPDITHIANYSYLDVAAVWTLNRRMQLRLGCNNLLDKDPPFIPLEVTGRGGSLNTFTTYDLLGRNVFVALRATL